LAAVLVQFVNPIAFATVNASLGGAMLFKFWKSKRIYKQDFVALIIIALVQIPLFRYNYIMLTQDPVWSRFTLQNQTLSPPPDYYLWGFAFFWPFAVLGSIDAIQKKSISGGAAIFWIISGFLLAYTPVEIQRRFLVNITIPLAILAIQGSIRIFESKAVRQAGIYYRRTSLIIGFVFLASMSSFQLGLGQTAYLQTHPKNLYYPASLDPVIEWFRQNAEPGDVVLAEEATSQILAQKAGVQVYSGHEMETLDYKNKQSYVKAFFKGSLPELAARPIKWVVVGSYERQFHYQFRSTDNLKLVYRTEEFLIYKIKQ
jgi:hypothetical protein